MGENCLNSYANYHCQLLLSLIQYLALFVLSHFAVTDCVSLIFSVTLYFIMHSLWRTNLMNMHKHLYFNFSCYVCIFTKPFHVTGSRLLFMNVLNLLAL